MKINAILMAAGNSCRFGSNKLLYMVDGKTMFQHTLEKVLAVEPGLFHHMIVITQYQEVMKQAKAMNQDIRIRENHNSQLGISHSIQLGLEAEIADAYAFFVCDQPWLKVETIDEFIKEFKNSKKTLGCVTQNGHLGNPAIFTNRYYQELLDLKGDVGGKSVMKKHMEEVFFYEVEDYKELVDIDVFSENISFKENSL